MIKLLLALTLITTVLTAQKHDPYDYYVCYQKESLESWATLLKKFPDSGSAHALHALQLGLCDKVTLKLITADQADAIMRHFTPIFKQEFYAETAPANRGKLIKGFNNE